MVQATVPIEIATGFNGERLPLPPNIMPSGFSWRPDGRLVFTTLRGEVFEAADTNHDHSEDQLALLADGLPTPYGVFAAKDYVDVSAKYAVLRLRESGRRVETVASGWGYTRITTTGPSVCRETTAANTFSAYPVNRTNARPRQLDITATSCASLHANPRPTIRTATR